MVVFKASSYEVGSRVRDREAFAAVALGWPPVVLLVLFLSGLVACSTGRLNSWQMKRPFRNVEWSSACMV